MIFLYSLSRFWFRLSYIHTHLILPSQTSPHIYRKCFCCSHKKAHDINFPSNSRHRRLRYVKGREREKQKDKNCLESQKHFTNDKHMKYFCMMEWKRARGWWMWIVGGGCGGFFLYEGRRRWGVTLCFRSSCLCAVCICVVARSHFRRRKAKFECEEFALSLSLLRYITL